MWTKQAAAEENPPKKTKRKRIETHCKYIVKHIKINETHNNDEKKDLLKILWELVTADSIVDAYEENLYFKIAELLKIKRATANQIKQQSSA